MTYQPTASEMAQH